MKDKFKDLTLNEKLELFLSLMKEVGTEFDNFTDEQKRECANDTLEFSWITEDWHDDAR